LPSGVTLQPIDGGPTYFADHGFTVAKSLGWDDPSHFPIGPFNSVYNTAILPNCRTLMSGLGWNTLIGEYHGIDWDPAAVTADNISTIQNAGGSALTSATTNMVGILTSDEVANYADLVSRPISGTANGIQDTRFWTVNCTWEYAANYYDPIFSGAPAPANSTSVISDLIATPNGTKRHIDINSVDIYWFTGSRDPGWSGYMLGSNGAASHIYGGSPTVDQCARGSNYGDVIDIIRGYHAGLDPAPVGIYLETGDPFTKDTNGSSYIKPPEFNWAAWSMVIHGARFIWIFDHSFSGPGSNNNNLLGGNTYYTAIRSGQTISMWNQVSATCKLIGNLAPIINSSFALGYVTVTPVGYSFPTIHLSFTGGIDICAHYYTGGTFTNAAGTFNNGFYIFATTRYGLAAAMPVTATFTVADLTATTATAIGESRTIPIVNGVFSDTFAKASTVHVYEIS
jgi:hypothetical protein